MADSLTRPRLNDSLERMQERIAADRPPINPTLGYHPYQESEFPEGAGHCDACGGGPLAEIHQKPVDQLARIADALESIAAHFAEDDVALYALKLRVESLEKVAHAPVPVGSLIDRVDALERWVHQAERTL